MDLMHLAVLSIGKFSLPNMWIVRCSSYQVMVKKNVVKILLNDGAGDNAPGKWSKGSALQLVSRSGHENVVKMLLDRGADVNTVTEYLGRVLPAFLYPLNRWN